MARVERVKKPFEAFALLPVVHRDRDEAEPGREVVSDRPQRDKEADADARAQQRMLAPQDVEQEHGQHTEQRVVRVQQQRGDGHHQHGHPGEEVLRDARLFAADHVKQHERKDREEECHHNVLVPKPDHPVERKVERHLAHERENAHPQQILFPVSGVDVPFCDAEREDRHREAPDCPHPDRFRKKDRTNMIHQHTHHRDQLQDGAIEKLVGTAGLCRRRCRFSRRLGLGGLIFIGLL